MKFQNPSFIFYFLNGRTDAHTHPRTDKPKAICSPLFQSWGHKNIKTKLLRACLIPCSEWAFVGNTRDKLHELIYILLKI